MILQGILPCFSAVQGRKVQQLYGQANAVELNLMVRFVCGGCCPSFLGSVHAEMQTVSCQGAGSELLL